MSTNAISINVEYCNVFKKLLMSSHTLMPNIFKFCRMESCSWSQTTGEDTLSLSRQALSAEITISILQFVVHHSPFPTTTPITKPIPGMKVVVVMSVLFKQLVSTSMNSTRLLAFSGQSKPCLNVSYAIQKNGCNSLYGKDSRSRGQPDLVKLAQFWQLSTLLSTLPLFLYPLPCLFSAPDLSSP